MEIHTENITTMEGIEESKSRCSNCKCFRDSNEFIGKRGVPVKRCQKCRDKDDLQKQRPDVVAKRNKRNKEKKYYEDWRKKKREENEREYLDHQASVHKKWRTKNKVHLAKWQTQDFRTRFYAIKRQAQVKGIVWKGDLTDQLGYQLMASACFYCAFFSEESLNGIDRLDNSGCYEASNVVSCCQPCNFIKCCLDPNTFISRCKHISFNFQGPGCFNHDAWSDSNCALYKEYIKRSAKKDLEFALTKEQFQHLSSGNCFYCNKSNTSTHSNGLDRKNNEVGYVVENCVSCCGECNQMKGSMSDTDFILNCQRVASHIITNTVTFSDDKQKTWKVCKKTISPRSEKVDIPKTTITVSRQQPKKEGSAQTPVEIEKYVPKQRTYTKGSNLPENCGVDPQDIPKYCYYVPATTSKGDAFACGRHHPKQVDVKRDWCTTKARAWSTKQKFQMLLDFIRT
jgi:hypothetical protein